MNNYNDKKDGVNTCSYCQGQGKLLIENIKIFEVCENCNGDGGFTWLEKVFGKKRSSNFRQQQRDNLDRLRYLLDTYARRLGLEVKIEFRPYSPDSEWFFQKNSFFAPLRSQSPVFKKIDW